jgi:hypothetical protein
MASLGQLESAFFTSWNEDSGRHVDEFWRLIAANELPYTRKDVIGTVLARGVIRTRAEYDVIVDSLVVAQQDGRISVDQASRLSEMIGRYEQSADEQ